MKKKLLIEPHYFPNIQFFSKFLTYESIVIDNISAFEKQSYRNRTLISGANKVLPLIVPVKRGKSKIPISKVEIENTENWQKNHWISIESAYNNSPYFFYYQDHIKDFFEIKHQGLLGLNISIIETLQKLLQLDGSLLMLSDIQKDDLDDFRNCIHPKPQYAKSDSSFKAQMYFQVFSDRFDFIPNLSILDLLFNMGPESREILERCLV